MNKDYYNILGVSEFCTEQELKSAYRKLARKWHPDVAGSSIDVVNKFKEIAEAYEILSDKTKKSEYDTIRRFYNYSSENKKSESDIKKEQKNTTSPNFKNTKQDNNTNQEKSSAGFNFNWEDFVSVYKECMNKFENINQENKKNYNNSEENNNLNKTGCNNQKRGNDINTDVEITIAEAINGGVKIINMLHTQVCQNCGGRRFINGAVCTHCKGKGDQSEHRRFTVKIPAGIKDNSKIRLAGEGEKGINGGKNGDLYITVHIKAPVDYKTDGNNILKTITIAPHQAVLGDNVRIKTPEGSVSVKISPNTQNGQKIRLSGCGLNINGKIGDMVLTVEIQIPKILSNQEIELYEKLRQLSSQHAKYGI